MITTLFFCLLWMSPPDEPLLLEDDGIELSKLSKEGQSMLRTLELEMLKVERAFHSLRKAESDLEQTRQLLEQGIYTNQDREVIQTTKAFHDANYEMDKSKIDLEKKKLEFFQNATHITIVSAVKSSVADQRKLVKVTLRNTSDLQLVLLSERLLDELVGQLEERLQEEWDDEILEVLPTRGVRSEAELISLLRLESVIVSVLRGGVNIGLPYEWRLEDLRHDKEDSVEFELQQDVDDLTVALEYLEKREANNVFLQTEAKEDIVTVTSQQFAQEGELGTTVSFDLSLERFSEGENQFQLMTLGLPEKYHHRFIEDQRRRAAVRRVKFTRRLRRVNLSLEVDIPKEMPAEELLKPIKFFGVVADSSAIKLLKPFVRGDTVPSAEVLSEAGVGYEELELVPKGVGEIEITAPAQGYYYRTKPEDDVEIRFFLENTGTSALADVRFEVKPSSRLWKHVLKPEKVDWIEPGKKEEIILTLSSDEPMEIGEYSLKLEASCELSGRPILAEASSFRVHVEGQTDVTLAAILLGAFLVLVVGITVVGIRISRR